jgi:hypothetical protein
VVNKDAIEVIRRHMNAMFDELASSDEARGGVMAVIAPARYDDGIPTDWTHVESREGETYSWPELLEEYTTFDVYEGRRQDGVTSRWAIGECERVAVWGKDRKYYIVFRLGSGNGSKQPICEFLETDDYEATGDLVAIIRGSGGPRGQRMFDPGAALPRQYDGMRIETYRDRIAGTDQLRGWNKLAVVAHEEDSASMLRHAAIQVHLRHS